MQAVIKAREEAKAGKPFERPHKIDMPDPEWVEFFNNIETVGVPIYFSKNFDRPRKNLPIARDEVAALIHEIFKEKIQSKYAFPQQGWDFQTGDERNRLNVTFNFVLVSHEAIPGSSRDLLIISNELKKGEMKNRHHAATSVGMINLPQYLVVDPDKERFRDDLKQLLSEVIVEFLTPAICFRYPDENFCDQFYQSFKRKP